jgi:hypothetical protein
MEDEMGRSLIPANDLREITSCKDLAIERPQCAAGKQTDLPATRGEHISAARIS